MQELRADGYSTVVFTSDSNHFQDTPELTERYQVESIDGVQLCRIRTLKYQSVRSLKRIMSWLHFELGLLRLPFRKFPRPKVIVVSSLSLLSVLSGIVLSKRFKARLVFEVRDIWPLTLTEEGGFSPSNPLVRLIGLVEKLGYRKADAIVGTMPNLEAHVREVSSSTKPVYCVPMGYDERMLTAPGEVPEQYVQAEVPKGKFVLGYAGSIGVTNALETLFECAVLLQDDESIHFVVVGSGDLREEYIRRYGTLPNVTFVDRVSRESVQAVLAQFDALYLSAFPSKVWEYGQSLNKLIDYMLAGKPVIASYSGYPSMLNEADSGVFVPAGDPEALKSEVQRMAGLSPEEREEMGAQGREWFLENRSYPALAKDYERILFPNVMSKV